MPKKITNQFKSHLTPDHMIHGLGDTPLHEIHQLLEDTAADLAQATTNTAQWPALILHLLQSLETHTSPHEPFEERLVSICEKITRKLNKGHW
ncbi:hypothetical protein ACFLXI_06980 [Chloroflexota bacterium]